jgi:peptidoglycan hydrolase-like protein with peptidoglycan-binding domain
MRAAARSTVSLAAACLALMALLVAASSASAAFGDRALREGMEGADVKALQRKLTRLGFETAVDGYFGRDTKRRMKRYERRHDRRVNGTCSRADARSIERRLEREDDPGTGEEELPSDPGEDPPNRGSDYGPEYAYGSRRLAHGDRGTDVARLQRLLSKQGLETAVDGHFGKTTRSNVKRWEAWRYARADGKVSRSQAVKIRNLANKGGEYVEREHVFPVRGRNDYGGREARFGAPRSGHTHMGQDILAKAGTKLVAVHNGKVETRQYQAQGAGNYLVIHGRDGSDSVYMHLAGRAIVGAGDRVRAGEKIGEVGCTGSCTGSHLHFELWTPHWYDGGKAYDPLPKLKRWDRKT